jgi:hypothetical protein
MTVLQKIKEFFDICPCGGRFEAWNVKKAFATVAGRKQFSDQEA